MTYNLFSESYLALVQEAQNILRQVDARLDPSEIYWDSIDHKILILKDHVWSYHERHESVRIATSALFTYLSPKTRHPLAFNCNARRALKDSITTAKDLKRSYATALKDVSRPDPVSMSTNRQVYYLLANVVHASGLDNPLEVKKDDLTHPRSMTHVVFGKNSKAHMNILLSNHGFQSSSLETINQLFFLLGIQPFAVSTKRENKDMSYVEMERLLEHFKDMPFHGTQE